MSRKFLAQKSQAVGQLCIRRIFRASEKLVLVDPGKRRTKKTSERVFKDKAKDISSCIRHFNMTNELLN